jgi:hypothetical protein
MVRKKYRLTKHELARRGHSIYLRSVLPKLRGEKKGRQVAIDIKSRDFAVADKALEAVLTLRARRPRAQVWLERIGYRTSVVIRARLDEAAPLSV